MRRTGRHRQTMVFPFFKSLLVDNGYFWPIYLESIEKGGAAGTNILLPFTQFRIRPKQQRKNLWGQGLMPLGLGRLIPTETFT